MLARAQMGRIAMVCLKIHLCSDSVGGFPMVVRKYSELASAASRRDNMEMPEDSDRICGKF